MEAMIAAAKEALILEGICIEEEKGREDQRTSNIIEDGSILDSATTTTSENTWTEDDSCGTDNDRGNGHSRNEENPEMNSNRASFKLFKVFKSATSTNNDESSIQGESFDSSFSGISVTDPGKDKMILSQKRSDDIKDGITCSDNSNSERNYVNNINPSSLTTPKIKTTSTTQTSPTSPATPTRTSTASAASLAFASHHTDQEEYIKYLEALLQEREGKRSTENSPEVQGREGAVGQRINDSSNEAEGADFPLRRLRYSWIFSPLALIYYIQSEQFHFFVMINKICFVVVAHAYCT